MTSSNREWHVQVLARTMWGEGRYQVREGLVAVAAVVLNRVARAERAGRSFWWGSSIAEVCLAPKQFSCWNARDPSRPLLIAVAPGDPDFDSCLAVAAQAVDGKIEDPTYGADHYFNPKVADPQWARGREPSAVIGDHTFLKLLG